MSSGPHERRYCRSHSFLTRSARPKLDPARCITKVQSTVEQVHEVVTSQRGFRLRATPDPELAADSALERGTISLQQRESSAAVVTRVEITHHVETTQVEKLRVKTLTCHSAAADWFASQKAPRLTERSARGTPSRLVDSTGLRWSTMKMQCMKRKE